MASRHDNWDGSLFKPLVEELSAIRAEAMSKFYATLTPDQRAKADQIQQRVQQRMSQHKG